MDKGRYVRSKVNNEIGIEISLILVNGQIWSLPDGADSHKLEYFLKMTRLGRKFGKIKFQFYYILGRPIKLWLKPVY